MPDEQTHPTQPTEKPGPTHPAPPPLPNPALDNFLKKGGESTPLPLEKK